MYNHKELEKKWQKYWEENKTFKVENDLTKPKYYCLDMFPYPSGAGLHVGHPEGMTANDIVARYKTAKGFNVLHPMGWDAFGLPAENYAIKTGTHPRTTTDANISNFRKQIKALGFSYDWDREVDTTDPKYYKWTQWIFLKLFEKGLAYEQDLPINYCPNCKTWLANEEVLNDFTCERCGTKVEKRKIRQWVLWITKYADRLLNDVDKLDWPEGIKDMQRNWIGKSEWCEFELKKADDETKGIRVYTTRVDTVFGMTYAVLAPDHKDVEDYITSDNKEACEKYISDANSKSDQDRTADDKEKTGVFTGSYVVNPFSGKEVPLWIGDYVLGNYGTGAVMAVPAHDDRDYAFAKKYNLEIDKSILTVKENKRYDELADIIEKEEAAGNDTAEFEAEMESIMHDIEKPTTKDGVLYAVSANDEKLVDAIDMTSSKARKFLTNYANENNFWEKTVNYKLRDWLFSRQRYWGEPIPLIHLDHKDLHSLDHISDISEATDVTKAYILKRAPEAGESTEWVSCGCGDSAKVRELIIEGKVFSKIYDGIYGKIVCDYRLPLELPEVENYEPAGDGNSPLAKVEDFVHVQLAENLVGKRETNTMPQWGGSCWYYLRYMDADNEEQLVSPEIAKYWGEVDSYVGWAEHAVLHLLYARFWHKFLYDIDVVPSDEPFYRLRNQWLILAYSFEDSKGKLLPYDEIVNKDWELILDEHEELIEKNNLSDKNESYFHKETGEKLTMVIAKMSKSLKNVVNPDKIVEEYGADSLRLYEMYMAEFKDAAPWDSKWIVWVKRFLDKSERLFSAEPKISTENDEFTEKLLHKTIKKVEGDIENYKFNTAIASMMILVNNGLPQSEALQAEWKSTFVRILHPFAPHLAEELNERIGNSETVFKLSWPEYDESKTVDNTVKIGVQVLGKLRGDIEISKDEDKDSVLEKARTNEQVAKWLEGKEIVKEIYVPGKIVNLVVK